MTYTHKLIRLLIVSAVPLSTPLLAEPLREEMVVTASRVEKPLGTIPNTVTVINQQDLQQQISINNDLSTILGNLIPSFSPSRQKLTSSGESLRGRNPLYMIDGVPQSNPLRDGARDAHTIDPVMLERVEVIHGANAIHGLGASGGIINLITRRPTEELQQNIRVETFFQDEDFDDGLGYGAAYSISGAAGAFDALASLSYREMGVGYDADGEVIGFDNTQGDTMDTRTLNGFVKAGYNRADQRFELTMNHYDVEGSNDWVAVPGDTASGVATTAVEGDVPGDAPRNEVTLLSLNYTHADILGHNLRVLLFRQDFAATYGGGVFATFQDPVFGPNLFDQSQNNSEKLGMKLTLVKDQLAGLPLNLVYGVDVFQDETWQELVQTGRNWVPETVYQNYAPYLQAEFDGIDRLVFAAGVRHEESRLEVDDFTTLASTGSQFVEGGDPDFSETLYNAGATYQITQSVRVYANVAEAFSMPDVGRVLRGINQPNQSVETFLELEPILTENAEVGVEYNTEKVSAQLTWYTSESDFGQRLQRGADGIFSVERERTEIEGIEFRTRWFATRHDVFGLRYAYTEGEYDSDGDGDVDSDLDGANIGPNRINLSWDRTWSASVSTRLQVNHLLDRDFDDSTGTTVAEFDGYTTVDFNTEIALMGGQLSVGVQNLTNKDYFTYFSQTTGRNTTNFKGFGRSFSLAYQYRF